MCKCIVEGGRIRENKNIAFISILFVSLKQYFIVYSNDKKKKIKEFILLEYFEAAKLF